MATRVYSVAAIGAKACDSALNPLNATLRALIKNSQELKYCIPNEIICSRIGQHIGLPVPPCGVVRAAGHDPEYWFASLNFNLTATDLPPIDPLQCVREHPSLAAGIVLFDILIANEDRRPDNLALDSSVNPSQVSVFDHSHALFGWVNGSGVARLSDMAEQFGIGMHCLLDHIGTDNYFHEWCSRIGDIPKYLIDEACESTIPLGFITADEAEAAKAFLNERKTKIEEIIRSNKSQFRGIMQWGLVF